MQAQAPQARPGWSNSRQVADSWEMDLERSDFRTAKAGREVVKRFASDSGSREDKLEPLQRELTGLSGL